MARGFEFFRKRRIVRGASFRRLASKIRSHARHLATVHGVVFAVFVLEAWGRAAAYPFGPRNCVVSFSIASAASRHCDSQLRGKRKVRSAPPTRRSARHMPGVAPSRVQRAVSAGLAAE